MAKTLTSVTLTAPSSDPSINTSGTFGMTAALAWDAGHGGNETVTLYFEYGTSSGGPYNTIPSSGSELTTADTNPASVNSSPSSITVTGAGAGTYYVRARGVGSSTFSSSEQLVTVNAGAITGDLAATDVTDTAALAGDVLVAGDLAGTDVTDTAVLSGGVLVDGDLAATDIGDTAALAGSVATIGSMAATDISDAAALTGEVLVAGALAAADVTDTASMAGAVRVAGNLGATDTTDSLAATGTTQNEITGDLAGVDTTDSAALTGSIPVSGDLAVSDDADALAATGIVLVQGDVSVADLADSGAMTGQVLVAGDLAGTESQDTASFNSAGTVTGTLSAVEIADSANLGGTVSQPQPQPVIGGGGYYVHRRPSRTTGQMVVSETVDSVRIRASVWTEAQMAASDAPDGMQFQIELDDTALLINHARHYAARLIALS